MYQILHPTPLDLVVIFSYALPLNFNLTPLHLPAIQQSSGFRDELRNTCVVVQYCKSFIPKLGPEENATTKGIQICGK